MRHLFFAVLILCVTAVLSYASSYNFKCLSRNGWSPGYGRYSYQGEWVDYFSVRAKAGEYVLFSTTPRVGTVIGSLEVNATNFNKGDRHVIQTRIL